MQLVEQHCIGRGDSRYDVIDRVAFASKNLYNAALYEMRQAYIHQGYRIYFKELYHLMKSHEAYHALPAKVAQQVLRLLDKNWTSYVEAVKAWNEDPSKFLGHPKLPKYKDKQKGRNILVFTVQAVSKRGLTQGIVQPSGVPIEIQTQHTNINQVRIVPRGGYYVVEVVYTQVEKQADVDPLLYAGIDIGINNLATLASNKSGFVPRLVNGRPVKSINQFYNKQRADLQSRLHKEQFTSSHLERFTTKRTRKIDHYLHTASKQIVDLLVSEGIGTLVIGKNVNWKQEVNIGKRNNQNFVNIPHARFIDMLAYKAQLVGIAVVVTEESYTSKCSFLDNERIGKHEVYVGKRVKRGLFRSASGKQYNADVNGAYNIIRKVAPDAFGKGVEDCVVNPVPFQVQSPKSRIR
ncbi:MAG: RNA-guided endonuclease TnpB family protein [Ktedonobacteraceae bacterium]